MGALSIAFDITIVGALALPWVLLVVHLFFFEGENRLGDLLKWVKDQDQAAAAGVVLFAVAYTMGSAVSRIAYDFFNDDDLHMQVGRRILRVGATQNRILTSVYCQRDYNNLLRAGNENAALVEKIYTFQSQKSDCLCRQSVKWVASMDKDWDDDDLNGTSADIFGLQENALMLKGEDPTLRLRQLHDQVMVLRGAAFNGILMFAFCLYGWGQRRRREKPDSLLRWLLAAFPLVPLLVGAVGYWHHLQDRIGSDPPFMEFCLLLLGVAGACLLWGRGGQVAERKKPSGGPCRGWPAFTVVSGILMSAALMGWWSTQVTYTEQVIYSYDALNGSGAAK